MNSELLARRKGVMPSWLALFYDEPLELVRGEGRRVWDAEGRCYLDFFGGILTTLTAHGLPELTEAIASQAGRILHTSTLYLNSPAVELAERIAALSGIPDAKVFFTTSGTEANDAALLLATTYRRSNQILALRNSYHGRSFSSLAVTGSRFWSASTLSGLSVGFVHGGYRLRSPWPEHDDKSYTAECVADLRSVLDMCMAPSPAALIAEPIQGAGGFCTPPDGFFGAMAEVLAPEGILFISDEVQTGWGRTGEHFWGYEAHGVVPDLMTFAKGLANGLPIGGVVGRAEIMDCIGVNSISTFGGNPLASAAALANLEYLLRNDLQTNAAKMGNRLRSGLEPIAESSPGVAELRGKGLMLGMEMNIPGGNQPDPGAAAEVMELAKAQGLLIGRGGLYGNVLRIAPPLTVTASEIDEAAEVLRRAVFSLT